MSSELSSKSNSCAKQKSTTWIDVHSVLIQKPAMLQKSTIQTEILRAIMQLSDSLAYGSSFLVIR